MYGSMSTSASAPPPLFHDWQPQADVVPPAPDEIRVLRVDLGPLGDSDEPETLPHWAYLSEDERARGLRFVRPRDRRKFVLCRGALRAILGGILEVSPDLVRFRAGPGGKPELAPDGELTAPPRLRFNVTHSGDLALIAVSADRELGIDVEHSRAISQAERIVESYFTPAEQAQFLGLAAHEQAEAFLRGWTRKEAILKAKGVGLAGLANRFETMFGTSPLSDRFTPASPRHKVDGWTLWEATPCDGYVAALAVGDPWS